MPAHFAQALCGALDHSDNIVMLLEASRAQDLRIVDVNPAFCRATGYDAAEAVGQSLLILASAQTDPSIVPRLAETAARARSMQSTMLCRTRAGRSFWLDLQLMPTHAPSPVPQAILLGRDITQERRTADQDDTVQSLLAKVFLRIDVAVGIATLDGRLLMTNPTFDRLLGWPVGELLGHAAEQIIAPDSRETVLHAWERQIADGREFSLQIALQRPDGGEAAATLTSALIARRDIEQFRIITLRTSTTPRRSAGKSSAPAAVAPGIQIAGKIRLVGLDEVKTALGDRWETRAERAMQTAEHVLRRRLASEDTFSRTDDQGYLICFASATEEEASFRAAMIGREIRNRLIGEGEDARAAHVNTVAASLHVPTDAPLTDEALNEMLRERLDGRIAALEQEARTQLRSTISSASYEVEPVQRRENSPSAACYVRLPVPLDGQVCAALGALPPPEAAAFNLDGMMLAFAGEQAMQAMQAATRGSGGLVLVNIRFEIFQQRARTSAFFDLCRPLSSRVISRLMLMISQIPPNLPGGRLLDCMHALRPFCRSVGVELDEPELPALDARSADPPLIALDNKGRGASEWPDARIRQLAAALHARNARLLIRGVPSWADAERFRALGADLFSVDASLSTGAIGETATAS